MNPSTTGYPSSLTVLTPRGPCTFTMRWSYTQLPLTAESTGPRWRAAQASAEVACYRWKAIDDSTYSTRAAVDVNEADLTWENMTIDIGRPVGAQWRPRVPNKHRELWGQDAAAVLKDLLNRENVLMLRRTDSFGALRAARRVVTMTSDALDRAHEAVRFHEALTAALALEDSTQRAIALRLLPDWRGTTEELLTTVAAIGPQEE